MVNIKRKTKLADIVGEGDGRYLKLDGLNQGSWTPTTTLVTNLNADLLDGRDESAFALLVGRSGGQTIIGGTGTSDDLILRATSGAAIPGSNILFQVGNNGATEAMKLDDVGNAYFSQYAAGVLVTASGGGISANAQTGMIAATAAGSLTGRTITGTTNQITVTNGDGVSGNPTLATPQDIATTSDVTFGSSILAKAGVALDVQNTTDAASNQVAIFRGGNRVTPADNDEGYISFTCDNDLGNQQEFARMKWIATDVTSTTKDAQIQFGVVQANSMKMPVLTIDGLKVGIRTALPAVSLHIVDGGTAAAAGGESFLIQDTTSTVTDAVMSLLAGTAGDSRIQFGDGTDRDQGFINYTHLSDRMDFGYAGTSVVMSIAGAANQGVSIGTTTFPTASGGKVLTFGDNAAQPTMGANTAGIYGYNDGLGTVELYVVDSGGIHTQISSHDRNGDWIFYSRNEKTGKVIKVKMEKLIKRLNEMFGEKDWFEKYIE